MTHKENSIAGTQALPNGAPKPPKTDKGWLPNIKWNFADSYPHVLNGGLLRLATIRELPIATEMSGVLTALDPGSVREAHWHKENEWAYLIRGSARITVVDQELRTVQEDVFAGGGWFFPTGIPHSIQALEEGCEFLLVFDNANLSEENVFNLTDWLSRTPREVICQSIGAPIEALSKIPESSRGVFPSAVPGPLSDYKVAGLGPIPQPMTYQKNDFRTTELKFGKVHILDSVSFPITTIAAAMIELEPGGLREMHWHPNADEWQYYLSGTGRMTVFVAPGRAQTVDFSAGDIGYISKGQPHYIQNTGQDTLRVIETFNSPRFQDIPLAQWLKYTPHQLITSTLNVDKSILDNIPPVKTPIVGPAHRG